MTPLERFGAYLGRRISYEAARSGRPELADFVDDGLTITDESFGGSDAHLAGTLFTLPAKRARRDPAPEAPQRFDVVVRLGEQSDVRALSEIDFEALMPTDGMTGWLTIDLTDERIVVDSSAEVQPIEDIVRRGQAGFTVVPRDDSRHDEPDRTHRAIVHGAGFPENPTPDRRTSRAGELRHARRTGKHGRSRK